MRRIVLRCSLIFYGVAVLGIFYSGRANTSVASPVPQAQQASSATQTWTPPDLATIPKGPLGDSIRLGLHVFDDTPKYAKAYVGNKMSCGHCHVLSGTLPGGIPMVGVPGLFPMYREREKAVVTFEERIQQCFQRSENGHRLPSDSPEMVGLVAYSQWLSKDQVTGRPFPGRGLVALPALTGDPERGGQIYAEKCAMCHGTDGAGTPPTYPPLWGPGAYNAGAGMNRISTMAAFVRENMPQNDPGSLTAQQAYDVAAYVNSKPHTPFNIRDHQ
jgi:thiosulfate dehydrogenase